MLRQSLFSDRGAQVLAGLTEVRRHGCDRLLRITRRDGVQDSAMGGDGRLLAAYALK
ncbi:hypothetical protein ABID95_004743 [Streptomyces atratus]